MYARIDECVSFANIPTEHRPVIQCEYAHAMGNSNGNYKVGKSQPIVAMSPCEGSPILCASICNA